MRGGTSLSSSMTSLTLTQTTERLKILKLGYVPMKKATERPPYRRRWQPKPKVDPTSSTSRFAAVFNEDFSQATKALYEREVARGVGENEEIFTGEEEVANSTKPPWANKYRPRKPRYFNRVQMGYEWNKYNQTHYDHDNPPPRVVQGYKFNIFYPDLIDKTKAPTYRIEREGGRKRGQSFAPAGEDDTCLIRFIAGPPYEDLAFRIVDKEWDYSAKRERGFRSSFDKVIHIIFVQSELYTLPNPLVMIHIGCDSPLLCSAFFSFFLLPLSSFLFPLFFPLFKYDLRTLEVITDMLQMIQGILQLHFQLKKVCCCPLEVVENGEG